MKKLLTAACLVFALVTAKADEGQKVSSKVQKVTVFLNGAQVTRSAVVNIKAGNTDLIFDDISPDINAESIQVHANGEFTILSVKQGVNYLEKTGNEKQTSDLQQRQKLLRDKINMQNNMLSIYQTEEAILAKNQFVKAENQTLDVIKLKQALDFQTERLTALKEKEQAINNSIAALNTELNKYDEQISELNGGREKTSISNITVTVSSQTALQSTFTLSYVVRDARWVPSYDIRAKNVNSPATIVFKANVSQQTGEDWRNIKLTLSTGNPMANNVKPVLTPYFLTAVEPPSPALNIANVSGRIFGNDDGLPIPGAAVNIKGTSIRVLTNSNGNYSISLPYGIRTLLISFVGYQTKEVTITSAEMNVGLSPGTQQLNEIVVSSSSAKRRDLNYSASSIPLNVSQTENQTNFEYNISNPYSVPSDGKQYLVEISQNEVKASYQYFVAPKISTNVFLTAQLTDWNKYNLLPGEANLFFEGTYIGKSFLNTNDVNDTLHMSLGIDRNIVVTRKLQKGNSSRQTIGSNKKELRDWIIELKNYKSSRIDLLVEDQVPVSQSSSIEVEVLSTSGGKLDPVTGKISWNLLLSSQNDKKLELKYQVKLPKTQPVIVE